VFVVIALAFFHLQADFDPPTIPRPKVTAFLEGGHPGAGLIAMHHLAVLEPLLNRLFGLSQLRKALPIAPDERALAERMREEIRHQLGGPSQGNQLVLIEIDQSGFHLRPVLHGLGDLRWKRAPRALAASRTRFDFRLVFRHDELERRQLEHLAAFQGFRLHPGYLSLTPAE
jgi:hypothetical protein